MCFLFFFFAACLEKEAEERATAAIANEKENIGSHSP